jgi:hypothetical protein
VKLRSDNIVTSVEDEDYLEFTSKHESGWAQLLFGPAFVIVVGLIAWRDQAWWMIFLCAFGIVMFIVKWSRRSVCEVRVNGRELSATADVMKYPNRVVRYAPHAVKKMQYLQGDEGGPSGLYLNEDCIISGISEQEANQIVARIVLKFPQYDGADTTRTSMLHGDDSGITVLGLSPRPAPSESATRSNF